MHKSNVKTVDAKPLKAIFNRMSNARSRIVKNYFVR